MSTTQVTVDSWPAPKGYANGRIGRGPVLHIAGQVGWTVPSSPEAGAPGSVTPGVFESKDLVGQFAQALTNVITVLHAGGGKVIDIAEMTIYVTDIVAYRAAQKQLGPIWKERMGSHYPAMALVAVSALVEVEAVVEIQAVAYLEHPE